MDERVNVALKAVNKALTEPGSKRLPPEQKIAAQQLATQTAISEQQTAAERLRKLGESLQQHWREVCDAAIGSSERVGNVLREAENTFKSALLVLERAQDLIREEEERIDRVIKESREKAKRVVERCDAIERDIAPESCETK